MEFIAHVDTKTVFGTFEDHDQHALAYSQEIAESCFSNGMKIFKPNAITLSALKMVFAGSTICVYREIDDIQNGTFRVRGYDAANSWTEKIMSRAAVKKFCLEKIRAEFAETESA